MRPMLLVCLLLLIAGLQAEDDAGLGERWQRLREHLLGNDLRAVVVELVGDHYHDLARDWAVASKHPLDPQVERRIIDLLAPLHEPDAAARLAERLSPLIRSGTAVETAAGFEALANMGLERWHAILPERSQLADHAEEQIPLIAAWLVEHPPLEEADLLASCEDLVAFVQRHDLRNSGTVRQLGLDGLLRLGGDALALMVGISRRYDIDIAAFLRSVEVHERVEEPEYRRFDVRWRILGEPWTWALEARLEAGGWMVSEHWAEPADGAEPAQ